MTSTPLSLDVIRLQADGEAPLEIVCTGCQEYMVIHQPDDERPDRLLGTCPSCSAWYLINPAADVMVRLPDEDALRVA